MCSTVVVFSSLSLQLPRCFVYDKDIQISTTICPMEKISRKLLFYKSNSVSVKKDKDNNCKILVKLQIELYNCLK